MLDLHRFEKLATRFRIRDRDTGVVTPLRFNPSQQKINRRVGEWRDAGNPLWVIFLKARRLGVSTWAEALLVCQMLAREHAQGVIVAQLQSTADELFSQAKQFASCLPYPLPPPTQHKLFFPHRDPSGHTVMSTIRKVTAQTVIGGRGLTFSDIHMTEAAYFPGEDSFVSLLNTVSGKDPNNAVIIETTANGIEGPGESFYNYWQAAVQGDNGFLALFLPWYEDPGCVLDDELAADAPIDDYEKMLMREYQVTKGQIAWFRWCLEAKCSGSIYKWRQEYPSSPEEAFVSTGNPAFDFEEIALASRHTKTPPVAIGDVELLSSTPDLRLNPSGPLRLFELPDEKAHYYIGVDAAKGVESGDFASAVGWNGCTGHQAFTYAAKIGPELMGAKTFALGQLYNKAMINVEFTGGWGYVVARELRDTYHYPAQYLWRSRDESPDAKPRKALGWETTDRSRRMLLDLFRTALRRGDLFPHDPALVAQMSRAVTDLGWRWTVIHGHDDIFMAALLGWVARVQYHPPHIETRSIQNLDRWDKENNILPPHGLDPKGMPHWYDDPTSNETGMLTSTGDTHLAKLREYNAEKKRGNRLEGI